MLDSFLRRTVAVMLFLVLGVAGVEARPRREGRGWLRSLDWKFAGVVLAQFAMANLDAHTSAQCIQRFPSCHEQNALLGSRPSTARIYTQLNLYIAGLAVAELYLKDSQRKAKGTKFLWLAGPALSVPYNVISTVSNNHLYNKFAALCRASGKLVC